MNIISFEPESAAPGEFLTITLGDMPRDADDENTTVYVGRQMMPSVEGVDPVAGTLKVIVDPMARTGTLIVNVRGQRGSASARSAREFTVAGDHAGKPIVSFMNPRSVFPGERVTLRGSDLDGMRFLYIGARSVPMGTRTAAQITFTVPVGFEPGQYRIGVKEVEGELFRCPYPLEVTKKEG